MESNKVLIVGAGPTGLAMGIELARQGVEYRLIEKKLEPAKWSQALVVQARTLEQFERYEIADRAVEKGRKLTHAELISQGKTVVSFSLDRIPGRYPFALFLPQSQTEQLLTERLESLGRWIERGVELVSFENQDASVTATLRRSDGSMSNESFRWVIGCDGAHSVVRHGLGIPFEGKAVGMSFLLGDLELSGPNIPADEIRIYLQHGDVVFIGRLEEKIWRVILVEHGRDWEQDQPTRLDFQRAIDRVAGPGIRVVGAKWISPYRVNERKTEQYRVDSVFLAGDACHIHSPVGGQGMNTGIQDAANLGWKLGAVVRGSAPVALLNTYSSERGAVGDDLLKVTSRGLSLATTRNPLLEMVRDAAAHVMTSLPRVQELMAGFISETAIHYEASDAVVDLGGSGHVLAGYRMPNPDGPKGRLLDALKSTNHLALVAGKEGAIDLPCPTLNVDPLDPIVRQVVGEEGDVLVVRPDGYVGFRGRVEHRDAIAAYARQVGIV